MTMPKWFRVLWIAFLVVPLAMGTVACERQRQAQDDGVDNLDEPDRDLVFNNITLEQADDNGALVWRMVADRAVYSQDNQVAQIDRPSGEFFRDNEPTLKIQAEQGEVRDDGEQIFLMGNVVATDVETGAIIRGDELEWRTGENVVIVRNNVIATHPDYSIAANQARASIDEQRIEVIGDVAAMSSDETLQVQGSQLVWLLEDDRLVSDRPIEIQQRDGNTVTGRARGDRAEFNMGTEVALFENNALVVLQRPPVRVSGDSLEWNLADNTVVSNQPLEVVHRGENITLQANQANGDLDTEVFYMTGDVVVTAQRNRARLMSDELTWTIPTQEVIAEGNVVYRQADPVVNLRGPRAEGKLENETIVVSGGRVVTEFIPEPTN